MKAEMFRQKRSMCISVFYWCTCPYTKGGLALRCRPPLVYPCLHLLQVERTGASGKLWQPECIQLSGHQMASLAISPAYTLRETTKRTLRTTKRARFRGHNPRPEYALQAEGVDEQIQKGLQEVLDASIVLIDILNRGMMLDRGSLIELAGNLDRSCLLVRALLKSCADLGLFLREGFAATLNRLEYSADHLEHFAESFRESANGFLASEISASIEQLQQQLSTVS
jgi:hypothetical protein